jgi:hypothetical protein
LTALAAFIEFHDAFAADLPTEETTVMAATQRRVAELAFSEPSGAPAWKERAGATITEVEGSHVNQPRSGGRVADRS